MDARDVRAHSRGVRREAHEPSAIGHTILVEDMPDVLLHRVGPATNLLGDQPIVPPAHGVRGHLSFARRECLSWWRREPIMTHFVELERPQADAPVPGHRAHLHLEVLVLPRLPPEVRRDVTFLVSGYHPSQLVDQL